MIPIEDYPAFYPIMILPPPGVLCGREPTDRSPELSVKVMVESDSLDVLREKYCPEAEEFEPEPIQISWGALSKLLAKIAHGATISTFGQGSYLQFLPDLILGKSQILSHYVGGLIPDYQDSKIASGQDGISISCSSEGYVVVNIAILGGRSPTYSVVAAKFNDFFDAISAINNHNINNDNKYDTSLKTRCLFSADWSILISNEIKQFSMSQYPLLAKHWPLTKSFKFEGYAVPQSYVALVMSEIEGEHPEGPAGLKKLPISVVADECTTNPLQAAEKIRDALGLGDDSWIFFVPAHDSQVSSAYNDLQLFTAIEKKFLENQISEAIRKMHSIASIRQRN